MKFVLIFLLALVVLMALEFGAIQLDVLVNGAWLRQGIGQWQWWNYFTTDHGASMLLIEAVPAEVSQRIVDQIESVKSGQIPIIGCGGGPACHGHVVVLHDLLGLTTWQPPFAHPMTNLGSRIAEIAKQWAEKVSSGEYLKNDHPYRME